MKKLKDSVHLLTALPFFALAAFFLLVPLANMVAASFRDPDTGRATLQNFVKVFTLPIYTSSIWNSIRIALISTAAGLVVSFFTALSVSTLGLGTKKRFMPIMNMTQNFAGFPLAFAFMLMVGHSGFLVLAAKAAGYGIFAHYNLYSGNGMIPLFIYFAIPLGTLLMIPGFQAVRTEWKEAATLLRANGFQFWLRVGLPVLAPTLLGTASMIFADAITTYTTVYMIMGTNYATLPIKIAMMFSGDSKQQTELGSALSLTMVAIILLVMGIADLLRKVAAKGGASK